MKMRYFFYTVLFIIQISFAKSQIPAYDISLYDTDGIHRNLFSELDLGKTVVLNFFSLYCGSCTTNTPVVEAIWQDYGFMGDSVWVWGIDCTGAPDSMVNDFKSFMGATFPFFSTQYDDVVIYEYDIISLPVYYIVCPNRMMKVFDINDIAEGIEACKGTLGIEELNTLYDVHYYSNTLYVNNSAYDNTKRYFITLTDIMGNTLIKKELYNEKEFLSINLTSNFIIYTLFENNIPVKKGKIIIY